MKTNDFIDISEMRNCSENCNQVGREGGKEGQKEREGS